ncbi:MAG: hypothetical protein QG622_908 [Actinomycetota bacterium]|nr:hypothetical protein [Actinomycetota bacterium]
MDLTTSDLADGTVVTLVGRFDAHEVPAFRDSVAPLLDRDGDLVVDLFSVVFIDSSALAELVRTSKLAKERDTRFALRNLSAPVRVILELTGLHLALEVEDAATVREPS